MNRRDNDIKAPDGFLLGGLRKVRSDGTILFQRGWWQAPVEWAGEEVWVHERWTHNHSGYGERLMLEAWPPGVRIYSENAETEILDRTERSDAKAGYRRRDHKAWAERSAQAIETAEPPRREAGSARKGESAVAGGDAPNPLPNPNNQMAGGRVK